MQKLEKYRSEPRSRYLVRLANGEEIPVSRTRFKGLKTGRRDDFINIALRLNVCPSIVMLRKYTRPFAGRLIHWRHGRARSICSFSWPRWLAGLAVTEHV